MKEIKNKLEDELKSYNGAFKTIVSTVRIKSIGLSARDFNYPTHFTSFDIVIEINEQDRILKNVDLRSFVAMLDNVAYETWRKESFQEIEVELEKHHCKLELYPGAAQTIECMYLKKGNKERTYVNNINFQFLPFDSIEFRMEKVLEVAKKEPTLTATSISYGECGQHY